MVIIIGRQAAGLISEWAKIGCVVPHPSWPPHPAVGQSLLEVTLPCIRGGWLRNCHTAAQSSGHGAHPPAKQDRHVSNHHHFKGECAYLAFLNLIQKEKTNQKCFETCLLLELMQMRVDMTLKASALTCTIYNAVISNLSLTSAKAALFHSLLCSSEICSPVSVTNHWQRQDNCSSAQTP